MRRRRCAHKSFIWHFVLDAIKRATLLFGNFTLIKGKRTSAWSGLTNEIRLNVKLSIVEIWSRAVFNNSVSLIFQITFKLTLQIDFISEESQKWFSNSHRVFHPKWCFGLPNNAFEHERTELNSKLTISHDIHNLVRAVTQTKCQIPNAKMKSSLILRGDRAESPPISFREEEEKMRGPK